MQSSPEARLVKQFDLLEMILQAHEYEELEGTPGRLQEFFDSTNGSFFVCEDCLLLSFGGGGVFLVNLDMGMSEVHIYFPQTTKHKLHSQQQVLASASTTCVCRVYFCFLTNV